METVLLVVMMGAALYFLMIRPQQKRAKEQQNLMTSLAPGARVMTISGIVGTIKYLGEKQAIIEVSPGVEMTIDKRAISTQPFEDEFEYADDADADDTDDAEPGEITTGAVTTGVLDDAEVVELPADETDAADPETRPDDFTVPGGDAPTWENPENPRN